MFNMGNVGIKISELRKSKNMTQMELADKMNISFQAVSNWERGNSMPDISKLPELAKLFDVTIDDILGEKHALVDSAADGKIDEYLDKNTVTAEELADIAPILKPEQVDSVFAKTRVESLSDIAELFPFISQKLINQLAEKAADNDSRDLCVIAPFTDGDVMNGIARKMISKGKRIAEIAPFIDEDDISELAHTSYKNGGLRALADIMPFIFDEDLRKIAEEEYAKNGLRDFGVIAPFLDDVYLNELAAKVIRKDGIKAIMPILPFIDEDELSEFVKEKLL